MSSYYPSSHRVLEYWLLYWFTDGHNWTVMLYANDYYSAALYDWVFINITHITAVSLTSTIMKEQLSGVSELSPFTHTDYYLYIHILLSPPYTERRISDLVAGCHSASSHLTRVWTQVCVLRCIWFLDGFGSTYKIKEATPPPMESKLYGANHERSWKQFIGI